MSRAIRRRLHRQGAANGVAYSREFLERLARILVRSGHSPKALTREFREICSRLKEPQQPWDASRLDFVADLPHVIAHWHSDAQYVDSRGEPLPLQFQARGPCLSELIGRVLPGADAKQVVHSLMQLKGLTLRRGFYRPTGQYLAYNSQTTSALAHGLSALLGMLSTLERNVWGKPRGALLERAATNPSFPLYALPAFHANLKKRAGAFIWAVDRDMRRYERRRRPDRTTRLGVCVFAFEKPSITTGRGARALISSRKRRT